MNYDSMSDKAIGEALGERFKTWRLRLNMTQQQLADLAGVGVRFIHDLERGKATLRLDKVSQVLAVFGKQLGLVDDARRQS